MAEHSGHRGVAPFAEIGLDAALRVTAWSERAEQLFAVTSADALGRAIAGLVPVDGGEAAWRTVLSEGDQPQVWPMVQGDDARVFEWLHRVVYDADDRVVGAVCHGRDVTARAAADRELALERVTLRSIIDHVGVVVWALDAHGVVVYHEGNAAVRRDEDLRGKNFFDLYEDPVGLARLRRAIDGELQMDSTVLHGMSWDSWMVPVADGPSGVALVGISLDVTRLKRGEATLRDKLDVIERQQQAIHAMSTPIIEVWDGVLTLPILGLVDSVRTAEIMDNLLQAVTRSRARFAILDMTGVEVVDTSTAGHLLGLVRAIRLLGAEGIITGIHPNIAQTMVGLDVDLSRIVVHSNLREALKYCIVRSNSKRR